MEPNVLVISDFMSVRWQYVLNVGLKVVWTVILRHTVLFVITRPTT